MVTIEFLQNMGWVIEQEAHGPSFKLAKADYKMWFIPGNFNVAIYDKLINEECQVIYRGIIATEDQFVMIAALIMR
jgi:hypothetical protein